MSFDYESLLKSAMDKIPKKEGTGKRFKVPTVSAHIQGNKTVVKNFADVSAAIRRDPAHVARFIAKELAAPASIQNGMLIVQTKVSKDAMQKKLESYIGLFVYCKICGEPDTKLEKEDRLTFMRCEACGARSAAKKI